MNECERTADQLRRAFQGDAWHGPSLREILEDVTPKQASDRPIEGAHTIWELVRHIGAWLELFDAATHGAPVPQPSAPGFHELDWPAVGVTDANSWRVAKEKMVAAADKHAASIAIFDPTRLGEKVPGRDYDYAYAFPGLVQHSLYHAGQIAVLKKALK
jgi:uncharacterized damage-inducible protein DinB